MPEEKRFSFTFITSKTKLGKRFDLDQDGTLKKSSLGDMWEGSFERRTVASLEDFASELLRCDPFHVFCYGLFEGEAGHIVTKGRKHKVPGSVARSVEDMCWSSGGGILFLDHDPGPGAQPLSRDDLVSAVRGACPFLADVKMLWRPSASSMIRDTRTGEMVRGVMGQRLYILIDKAGEIPRVGRLIFDRLWLAGHGRYDVSKAGDALSHTLVDRMVWQTNRFDYVGGAVVESPIEQAPLEAIIIPGDREYLSSAAAVPLSGEEKKSLTDIQARAAKAFTVGGCYSPLPLAVNLPYTIP